VVGVNMVKLKKFINQLNEIQNQITNHQFDFV